MHDKLLGDGNEPPRLERADIERYAAELGLDRAAFGAALARSELGQAVDADAATAASLGVQGVPGFFINGKFLAGAQPYEAFKNKVDAELKSARKLVAGGTPRAKVYAAIMR
jgi:protein-disulfide isomerase